MSLRPHRRRGLGSGLLAVAVLVAAAAPAAAASRRLALVLAPGDAGAGAVGVRLAGRGFVLGPALWSDARLAVYVTDATPSPTTADVYAAIEDARRVAGVIAAGELLAEDPGRVHFYSGRALARFRDTADEAAARSWGRPLGLTLVERVAGAERTFLFEAPLDPARLLALADGLRASGERVELHPIIHDLRRHPDPPPSRGVYQRIPPGRNLLAALLDKGVPWQAYETALLQNGGVVIAGAGTPRQVARFPDEARMMQAQAALRDLPEVRKTGPAVSIEPLAFLTEQLVVRFDTDDARFGAEPRLQAHFLQELRRLPWLGRAYLYRAPLPSYAVYDAARELILQGGAIAAVPNLVTLSASACGNDSCVGGQHQDYLREIDLCDVWSLPPPPNPPDPLPVVLAVLDEGVQANSITEPATQLAAGTVVDLESMTVCQPDDPSAWWSACSATFQDWTGWNAAHGNKVALLAAARHADSDLLGVAPQATLINAKRPDDQTDVAFAEALWWLAGGDPGWCRDGTNYNCTPVGGSPPTACDQPPASCAEGALPPPLDDPHRADVINLSFTREDFLVTDCSEAEICQLVCASPASCGVIDGVLQRIREPHDGDGVRAGGAVVVAAVGVSAVETLTSGTGVPKNALCYNMMKSPTVDTSSWSFHTDLAESPWTVAAGSVTTPDGWPFYRDSFGNACVIQFSQFGATSFLDVVAPLGPSAGTQICTSCTPAGSGSTAVEFGASSAATAAVSGVAALMLRHNPALTAGQVHCLLRQSARRHDGPSQKWQSGAVGAWDVPDCEFESGSSPCLGAGMIDACAAVDAALGCAGSGACTCLPPLEPELPAIDIDVDLSSGRAPLSRVAEAQIHAAARCQVDPRCTCHTRHCVRFRVRMERRPKRAEFKLCVGPRCWILPTHAREPKPGQEIVVPFDLGLAPLLWARATRQPLELHVTGRAGRDAAGQSPAGGR